MIRDRETRVYAPTGFPGRLLLIPLLRHRRRIVTRNLHLGRANRPGEPLRLPSGCFVQSSPMVCRSFFGGISCGCIYADQWL